MANKQQGHGRGFAGMDPERQHEIASKGGQSVPAEKRSFSRDHQLAAEAGHKGGQNSHGGSGNFAEDRDRAREAGRKGGQHSHGNY